MQQSEHGEEGQGRQEGAEGNQQLPQWVQDSLKRMTGLDKRLQIGYDAVRPSEEVQNPHCCAGVTTNP